MATIQPKICRGHKYWYIVESRRVNGKPRPIVLEYLGKAGDLLKRLQGLKKKFKIKSYSHGAVSALLDVAHKLEVPMIINKYIKSLRPYMAEKPVRNNLTAGITFLLGAIGRVCMPTSKQGWWNWARTTSCGYLLKCSLSKIDSQHFWDLMDSLPIESIEKIEWELLKRVREVYNIEGDTLFFDTTNFFTYIDSSNKRCTIAQRGRNKQKRTDLRQVGLAMVVTRGDFIPLFHLTYQGNMNDSKVFREVIEKIKKRMVDLGLDLEKHTIVFDRGANSKKNLIIVKNLELHYVGALTPYHHKQLVKDAVENFQEVNIAEDNIQVYRDKRIVWGEERTVIVFISDKLKTGQLRGIYQSLEKKVKQLQKIQKGIASPNAKKRQKIDLETRLGKIAKGQFIKDVIQWSLTEISDGKFHLDFSINEKMLSEVEDKLGFRILMTNRHEWETKDIIKTHYGQSTVENAFKNIKNPYHLAIKPQFHWTDQKIEVHFFICILGYLLTAIIWREAKLKTRFNGSIDTLLDTLNNVRLAMLLEESTTRGRLKALYKLEEMADEEKLLVEGLGIDKFHTRPPKFRGVSVYN